MCKPCRSNVFSTCCLLIVPHHKPVMDTQHQEVAVKQCMATEAQEKSTAPTNMQYQVAVPL